MSDHDHVTMSLALLQFPAFLHSSFSPSPALPHPLTTPSPTHRPINKKRVEKAQNKSFFFKENMK